MYNSDGFHHHYNADGRLTRPDKGRVTIRWTSVLRDFAVFDETIFEGIDLARMGRFHSVNRLAESDISFQVK